MLEVCDTGYFKTSNSSGKENSRNNKRIERNESASSGDIGEEASG